MSKKPDTLSGSAPQRPSGTPTPDVQSPARAELDRFPQNDRTQQAAPLTDNDQRTILEETRDTAETMRERSERERENAEAERQAAEVDRRMAEDLRKGMEAARQAAEALRETAEEARRAAAEQRYVLEEMRQVTVDWDRMRKEYDQLTRTLGLGPNSGRRRRSKRSPRRPSEEKPVPGPRSPRR